VTGPRELAEQLESVGLLAEPARRALYEHVVGQAEPVSREQAAQAVGMPVHSAKFHLDKLSEAGLLEVEYRRISGRTGPGAGRPSKLYRRSGREVALSVPARQYDLVGQVLAGAIERSVREREPVTDSVRAVAGEVGRGLALAHSSTQSGPARGEKQRTREFLQSNGYEPRDVGGDVCLGNCPFDRLADQHTELVCGMNLALLSGALTGLDVRRLRARLEPQSGSCCVVVGPQ
jgi:predicted ArsR family transcriptional regulator